MEVPEEEKKTHVFIAFDSFLAVDPGSFWENGLSKHICNKILLLKVIHSAGQQS